MRVVDERREQRVDVGRSAGVVVFCEDALLFLLRQQGLNPPSQLLRRGIAGHSVYKTIHPMWNG